MFIKNNSVRSALGYFDEKLKDHFSERERKLIGKSFIAKRLGWDTGDFVMKNDERVTESDLLYFRKMIKQLKEGFPFQYALGETYFYNILLKTDQRALIPRPETEELVDWIVSEHRDKKVLNILDIGTGSGCIPLALKNAMPYASLVGVDVSEEALSLAKENSLELNLEVDFELFNILESKAPFSERKFEVIVSNPPYIPEKDRTLMAKHVVDHEPKIALFISNDDPLVFYSKISDFAKENLTEKGELYFEIHESFASEVEELLKEKGFHSVTLKKDLQGKDRMIKCKL